MSNLLKSHEIRLLNTRNLLKEKDLSRADFAEKIGMTYGLLSQYIGRNPVKKIGDDTAEKIEDAFNLSRGYLDQVHGQAHVATNSDTSSRSPSLSHLVQKLDLLEQSQSLTKEEIDLINQTVDVLSKSKKANRTIDLQEAERANRAIFDEEATTNDRTEDQK